jgi:hypothetical protein
MQSVSDKTCGAKLVAGPCLSAPEPGKSRCRLHGGAPGSGAPKQNQNALKHGLCTREELAWLKESRAFFRQLKRARVHEQQCR